ncbi:Gfo/Idh/MocA family protein [Psychromicrobium xiongbiense]|uniref:Gfo/Idh/MocA family protein n=1 Tax=Psychromicrobium xiongbiense TaxID=3051184 RepID=UPI0025563095|nr:Gfo/Idh/MocA family oxidoreductase [Psychromicrobium sp. YIM S02556]
MKTYIARPDWYDDGFPNPLTATGRSLGWGVVATGGIAHTVTRDLALLEDATLQAVSSRSAESARAFAEEFGVTRWYADDAGVSGYQALCADPAVDVVYVATPHGQHYEVAKAALEAGKHVLCEKALTLNARQAEELVALAGERGLFLMEAMWARFVPGIQRALEIIREGTIGQVQWVRADLGFPAPVDPASRIWAPEAGGGALLDLTVYPLLWAWGTLGAPESLHAVGGLTPWGVDTQNAITLGYPGGAFAQLQSSLVSQSPRVASVCGSLGFVETIDSVNNPSQIRVCADWNGTDWGLDRIEEFEVYGSGYTYELREVTRCIQQGLTESPTMPWQDSVDIMRLFDGVRAQLGVSYPQDARD